MSLFSSQPKKPSIAQGVLDLSGRGEELSARLRWAEAVVVPYGKFAGMTLGQVMGKQLTYLSFLAETASKPELVEALKILLERHGGEIEKRKQWAKCRKMKR